MKRIEIPFGYSHPRYPNCIDLSLNESPYGCSEEVVTRIVNELNFNADKVLSTYPDEELYAELRKEIAKVYPGKPENIVLTDGGMGAMDLILSALSPTRVYVQQPTFQPIEHRVKFHDHEQRYQSGFTPVRIFINPNNPTGLLVNKIELHKSLKYASLTIVDEEYADYSSWTVLDKVNMSDNLMITRSFSKAYGLPSLRIGWITCSKKWAAYLRDVRYPWRIGRLACIAAIEAVKDQDSLKAVVESTLKTRSVVEKQLSAHISENSNANYIMLNVNDSKHVFTELLKKGYIVRDLKERMQVDAIRFMIHLPEIMETFVDELLKVL